MRCAVLLAAIAGAAGFAPAAPTTARRPRGVALAAAPPSDVTAIVLAGGSGSRMKANMPKQFLPLMGKPVLRHSLDLFLGLDFVSTVVCVIAEQHRAELREAYGEGALVFADPGAERQDSVYNGLLAAPPACTVVAVHDAARPLVTPDEIARVCADGAEHGAAVLGVPMKATVKASADGSFVKETLQRSTLWEIQTPQVVKPALLKRGFEFVKENGLEVTDDVSVVEHLGEPVKLTLGEYENLKLTTPEDMIVAANILTRRAEVAGERGA